MAETFGLKIGIEGEKEFRSQLADINQSFKVLGSEMKIVDSEFAKNDDSIQALTARNSVLQRSIDLQKNKIETLKKALDNSSSAFGENDKRTQAWQIQLNNAQADLNKLERELGENEKALKGTDNGFDNARKAAKEFQNGIKDASEETDESSDRFKKFGEVCKSVGAAIATACKAIAEAAFNAGKALVEMSSEGAKYADDVLTQSSITGIATDKLQEYMYAAELVDVSVDTLTNSMTKNIRSMKEAAKGSSTYVEAYKELGVAVTDAEGNLRNSDEVYWEIIEALGKIENETERDAIAMSILGRSAQELNPLIKAGSERMKELAKEAHETGYVLDEDTLNAYGNFDDELERLKNGCTAAKNSLGTILLPILNDLANEGTSLLSEFTNAVKDCEGNLEKFSQVLVEILPKALNAIMKYVPIILKTIGTLVTSIIASLVDHIDEIIATISDIFSLVLDAIVEASPKIIQGVLNLLISVVNKVLDCLPQINDAVTELANTLVKTIGEIAPLLIPKVVETITLLAKSILDNLPLILNATLELIKGLAKGILDAIPILLRALPEIIRGIIDFIISAIPQIINAVIYLVNAIVDALPEIIQSIIEVLPQIIDSIINAILELVPLIIECGFKLLTSIVADLPAIIEEIIKAIPQIIMGIVSAILGNIPKIIEAGFKLLVSLVEDLPNIIIQIVKAIPEIVAGIVKGFGEGVVKMYEVGKNLVIGLWEGIKSLATWIWDKVSEWATNLWNGILDFFGIHSPSKKMRFVGEMMGEGLAIGIDESSEDAIDSANAMTDKINSAFDDLGTGINVPTNFKANSEVSDVRGGQASSGGVSIQLSIDNFNNYTSQDINDLTNEIMETADNFVKRREVVFG